ncbi:hypothetical protein FQN49_004210 [Arthroderma sp. PD_2]|nr:hypothetical protein FQN49_004210 [Arthroderma sp. PD_2]
MSSGSGFSFPPPPPPPPSNTSFTPQPYNNNYNGRGRGNPHHRGRGRGSGPRRGRGGHGMDPSIWNLPPQHQPYQQAHGTGYSYGQTHYTAPTNYLPTPTPTYPPMRWGFDNHDRRQPTDRRQKRPHETAFTAPLPVPSFNTLPSKPPPPAPTRPRKQRKHNQLGLTPKTEEHESSESEADVDEEAKLAGSVAAGELKFSYKGKSATLASTDEIRAWIEERKRRFPTRQRVEQKREEEEARRREREEEARKREEEKKKMRQEEEEKKREKKKKGSVERARVRADRLREKLARQERKLAEAEKEAEEEEGDLDKHQPEEKQEEPQVEAGATRLTASTSNALLDETSSEGSESDSSDDGPEEASSRRQRPDRVLPPRQKQAQPCHQFAKTGQCRRGACPYSHDKKDKEDEPRVDRRKGLLERLLDGQREEEDRRVMQAIVWLGENRFLDPVSPSAPVPGPV